MSFTQEELNYLKVLQDPVTWAQVTLNWTARWYQENIVRDDSLRVVIRAGRRVGKSDSLCVKALHSAFTKPGRSADESFVVLIIAPYEAQVKVLFDRMREMINMSSTLKESVIRDVKSPNNEITLGNRAVIRGFTAGSKSGSGASQVRGQRGDLIILDEVDYFADRDIIAIMAIPLEDPLRIRVIASSTPTGRRSFFYRWCQSKSGWSHYHYPSSVNPTWSDEIEMEFRTELSELGYLQEVEAEFGEEAAGVFQNQYIDRAVELGKQLNLKYYDKNPPPANGNPRVLGVDWDSVQATPSLMGYEWDKERQLIIPIFRKEIARTEFSLDAGVRAVIDSNQEFNWDYIYVDRGYGEYQVETLRKFGLANPSTGLHKKIVGITFSDKIEVPDPHTKQKEKKDIKPWAVNNAAVMFERGQIALVPTDRILIKQLENYKVVSVGSTGRRTYTDKDEHFVDATVLALLGLTMKFTDISKIRYATMLGAIPRIDAPSSVKSRDAIKPEPVLKKTGIAGLYVLNKGPRTSKSPRSSRGSPRRKTF